VTLLFSGVDHTIEFRQKINNSFKDSRRAFFLADDPANFPLYCEQMFCYNCCRGTVLSRLFQAVAGLEILKTAGVKTLSCEYFMNKQYAE